MNSALQVHPSHHFLSKAEKVVYLREHGKESAIPTMTEDEDPKDPNGPRRLG